MQVPQVMALIMVNVLYVWRSYSPKILHTTKIAAPRILTLELSYLKFFFFACGVARGRVAGVRPVSYL